jgi:hypothetical protein
VFGVGFTGATQVRFGLVPGAYVTVVSDTRITAVSPPQPLGIVQVTVVTPGGTSPISAHDQFTYGPPVPVVYFLSPYYGPISGGTRVIVHGTGLTGTTEVTFGSSPGTSVTVISDKEVSVITPAQPLGLVSAVLTTPGGVTKDTKHNLFLYRPLPPSIYGFAPDSAPSAGGSTITILGANFSGATAVSFGSVPARFKVLSDSQISVVTPAHAPSPVYVFVTTPGGKSKIGIRSRFFFNKPTITSISPTTGSPAGGTTVTITGTGFTVVTKVLFGTVAATNYVVVSDTQITAVAPAETAGIQNIFVTTAEGTNAAVAADKFTFK